MLCKYQYQASCYLYDVGQLLVEDPIIFQTFLFESLPLPEFVGHLQKLLSVSLKTVLSYVCCHISELWIVMLLVLV